MKELVRICLVILAVIAVISLFSLVSCGGKIFDCYDATFVGSNLNYFVVTEKSSGRKREMHTYVGDSPLEEGWKFGDELVVCNDFVMNKTKNNGLPCADFGCMLWP